MIDVYVVIFLIFGILQGIAFSGCFTAFYQLFSRARKNNSTGYLFLQYTVLAGLFFALFYSMAYFASGLDYFLQTAIKSMLAGWLITIWLAIFCIYRKNPFFIKRRMQ